MKDIELLQEQIISREKQSILENVLGYTEDQGALFIHTLLDNLNNSFNEKLNPFNEEISPVIEKDTLKSFSNEIYDTARLIKLILNVNTSAERILSCEKIIEQIKK